MESSAQPSNATLARATMFVLGVSLAAAALTTLVWRLDPTLPAGAAKAVLLLGALALMGEAWAFVLPRSATASIAFIPYAAMSLVVPHWIVLAAVAAAKLTEAVFAKRSPIKALFNVALFVVMFSCTILVYKGLGGNSFLPASESASALSFAAVTAESGFAALVAICVSFLVNMVLLSTVIALHSGRKVTDVCRENHLPGLGLSVLAAPVVFFFAWVYVAWGPIAAALIWVPIMGYRHTMKTTIDLEQTNRELLELMVKSIEARDPYTSGHSRRVQRYALLIARGLKLPEREVEHIGTAALLHDVGKIHEKYGPILQKESKLTPAEWELMQQHPIDGAELVATMTRLQRIVPAIRHHHENWDGTGYPDGVAGESIPLASRIIMFADTIDAMTTVRPYRGALSEEIVRAELIRRRGSQFDPQIADTVLGGAVWDQVFPPSHPASKGHVLSIARGLVDRIAHEGELRAER